MADELDPVYGADQRLVSGPFYHKPPSASVAGHPFCIDEEWKTGMVKINELVFENLLLKYDITSNELVLNTSSLNKQSLQVKLKTPDISKFSLGDRQFIVFPGTENKDNPSFCELASSGEIDFLILRTKEMRIINSGGTNFEYKLYFKNYLRKDGELYKFKNRRSLFKLVPELKKELRKYTVQQGLVLSKNNPEDRALLVDYCNDLLSEKE